MRKVFKVGEKIKFASAILVGNLALSACSNDMIMEVEYNEEQDILRATPYRPGLFTSQRLDEVCVTRLSVIDRTNAAPIRQDMEFEEPFCFENIEFRYVENDLYRFKDLSIDFRDTKSFRLAFRTQPGVNGVDGLSAVYQFDRTENLLELK
ncbi:MAG: hypothetical protein ABJF89_03225 [Parasphingorhabdus sp.]|uniref:hypothetical protein n=1 Tax=Parasphingorhabdus sp. TaxID=2709688 RepID=UPI00326675C9